MLEFRLSVNSMVICSVVKAVTRIVPDKALLRFSEKFHNVPDVLENNLLCVSPLTGTVHKVSPDTVLPSSRPLTQLPQRRTPNPTGTPISLAQHQHQRPLGCGAPPRQRLTIFRVHYGPPHHALRCHGINDAR